MAKSTWWQWALGGSIAALIVVVPFVYYRWSYTHRKRLREVNPGLVYRSGQLTAAGFAEAIARYHIRTIINLQDDVPDPDVAAGYFTSATIPEDELCRRLGVRFELICPDIGPRGVLPPYRPQAIDRFLTLMDDRSIYPVLIHCKAGLHRTGLLTAIYRMEYQGWSVRQAMRELKANGFGEFACTSANDYVLEYVLHYKPRNQLIR
jgi:tyrosine-protein phosphatase SIW14